MTEHHFLNLTNNARNTGNSAKLDRIVG